MKILNGLGIKHSIMWNFLMNKNLEIRKRIEVYKKVYKQTNKQMKRYDLRKYDFI